MTPDVNINVYISQVLQAGSVMNRMSDHSEICENVTDFDPPVSTLSIIVMFFMATYMNMAPKVTNISPGNQGHS